MNSTLHSLTERFSDWWDWTSPNSASCPRYGEGLYPLNWHKTSLRSTQTSTPQCSGVSLTPLWRPVDKKTACIQWKKGYSKRPSVIYSRHTPLHGWLTQSNPLLKPHQATKKIEEKSTSTSHARMDNDAQQNGSSEWTGGRWPGTLKRTL